MPTLANDIRPLHTRGITHPFLENLARELPDDAWISGGALCSLLSFGLSGGVYNKRNDPFEFEGDIDVFFGNELAFRETLLDFLEHKPNSAYEGYRLETDMAMLEPPNNVPFVTLVSENPNRPKIQLIKIVWYTSADHVIDSFDFTAVQFAMDRHNLYYNPVSLVDICGKHLVIHRMRDPLSALRRMVKYASKGFGVSNATFAKLTEEEKAQLHGNSSTLGAEPAWSAYERPVNTAPAPCVITPPTIALTGGGLSTGTGILPGF